MKKPSAAKTPNPLESYTFLVEESLGKKLAEALRNQGLTAISLIEGQAGLRRGMDDEEWAKKVGEDGWIALTKDTETRYKPNEREAIVAHRARVIQFTRGSWSSDQMIEAFTLAKRSIRMLLHRRPGPFIARINKRGEITKVFTEQDLSGVPPSD